MRPAWRLIFVLLLLPPCLARGEEPLHQRIDALLDSSYVAPPAGHASEATLVRRLYLDLTGRIPTAAEAQAFLQDSAQDKWPQLVDRLLADPRFVKHLADYLDVALMERRADKHVKADQWRAFLEEAVASNRPFHELAQQILTADGRDPKQRGPAKFYLERGAEPNLLTRDIGRAFFGVDLQCAQCHDHPLIDDYYQADYYGIYAFVSRLSMFADKGKKISYLSEKFDGEVKYTSVFTDESGRTNPRLLWEKQIADDPVFPKGQEYEVKPDKNAAAPPKYSRRKRLAEEVGKGENQAFRRNIANRLWALMMGRGLVHPVDLHHSGNPAAHPQLLDLLADEIARGGFDMRAYLREIALTKAYRRDFALPGNWSAQGQQVAAQRAAWESELKAAAQQLEAAQAKFDETSTQFAAASKPKQEAEQALAPLAEAEAKQQAAFDKAQAALTQAQQQTAAAAAKLQLLSDAHAAADKARPALGENPPQEFREALATLQAKRDAAAKDHQAKTAAAAKQQAAKDVAAAQLKPAQEKSAPARAKLAELAAAVAEAEKAYRTAEAAVRAKQAAVDSQQRKLDEAQLLLTAAQQQQQFEQARAKLAAAQQAAAPVAQQRDPLLAQHKQAEASAAELAKQLAAATVQRDSLQQQLTTTTETLTLLSEATQLVGQIDGDVKQELIDALQTIDSRRNGLSSQQQKLQAEMESMTARAAKLQADSKQADQQAQQLKSQLDELTPRWKPLGDALAAADEQLVAAEAPLAGAVEGVRAQWSSRFAMTGLKALTPEQLCWSMLAATGQIEIQQAAAAAAINKKTPLSEADQKDPAKVAARERAIRQQADVKLKANVAAFVKLFAAGAGQPQGEFFATADQALFFRNGGQIRSWIGAGGQSLYGRLAKQQDSAQLADELYLGVLTRPPGEDERADVIGYLESRKDDRGAAIQDMMWALLTSIEFRFRH